MRQIRMFLLLIVLLSCETQIKFDKVKWQTKEDPAFPPQSRKVMLKDLQTNYKLEGISHYQIVELLGEPDYLNDSSMVYKVEENYGSDIDPVYIKFLEIKLRNDTVHYVDVHEWKK